MQGQNFIHNRIIYVYSDNQKLEKEVVTDLAEYRSGTGIYTKDFVKSTIQRLEART